MSIRQAIINSLVVILLSSVPAIGTENKQITYTLNTHDGSHQALMHQAQTWAKKLIGQAFAQNSSLAKVEVSIIGERNGQEVPLLTAKVSRVNWQKSPQIQAWTQYFNDSAVLLGFKQGQLLTSASRRPPNRDFLYQEVASSHLEPNFYK